MEQSTYYYYYYYAAIGCSPGGSRSYTDTDKERLYIKGTIQNKVHATGIYYGSILLKIGNALQLFIKDSLIEF
jgi:hypothetical protein